jgi:16S rRNA (cytosine967-C5)-methyltransferase
MPRWLAARWLGRYGPEGAADWARFCASPAPMVVRANRLRTTRDALAASLAAEGVQTEPARWAPDALVIVSGRAMQTGCFASGQFLVQDEASQLVALAAGVAPGERVLDTCAAPGGKASAMAASAGATGQLIAVDLRPKRVALLRETLARAGAERAGIVRADARRALPFRPVFDAVVVDAPCSGLGTIRRDPDVKWRRAESGLAAFAAAQQDLLRQAVEAVRPGGRLLYATCSSEPEENEQVVDRLLTESPALVPLSLAETPWWPRELLPLLDAGGRLKTEPPRHGLEAFFAALFVRRGAGH